MSSFSSASRAAATPGDRGAGADRDRRGIAATAVVLVFFVVDTLRNAPQTFVAIVAIAALAVILDAIWKRVRPEPPPAAAATPINPVAPRATVLSRLVP